jgi:hypothetical protein
MNNLRLELDGFSNESNYFVIGHQGGKWNCKEISVDISIQNKRRFG